MPNGKPSWVRSSALSLWFLVTIQRQRFFRWIEIQADDIPEFFLEMSIVRQLEGYGQVRLDVVCSPQALHAGSQNTHPHRVTKVYGHAQLHPWDRTIVPWWSIDTSNSLITPVPPAFAPIASCVCPLAASKMIYAHCRSQTDTMLARNHLFSSRPLFFIKHNLRLCHNSLPKTVRASSIGRTRTM